MREKKFLVVFFGCYNVTSVKGPQQTNDAVRSQKIYMLLINAGAMRGWTDQTIIHIVHSTVAPNASRLSEIYKYELRIPFTDPGNITSLFHHGSLEVYSRCCRHYLGLTIGLVQY